jgi:hypothetical protein
MAIFNTDFDGPPQYEAQGNWYMLTFFTLGLLLCGVPEAFGWATLGKFILGLQLVSAAPDLAGSTRYVRRWLFKTSPLLLLGAVSVAGAVHTEQIGWEGFYDFGWAPAWQAVVAFALPATVVAGAFLASFCNDDRSATYDALYGVLVVEPSVLETSNIKAFPVVLHTPDVAAIFEGLDQLDAGEGIPWEHVRRDLHAMPLGGMSPPPPVVF